MGDDYGYFGSGSSGYAHYHQTFQSCFGGSEGSGGGGGGHHNQDPDWSILLTLLKIGVLIVAPPYWIVTALHIAFSDMASIEPITVIIDVVGTPAFFCVIWSKIRSGKS